ncbi:hypothetical protein VTN00DRAFT_3094 [Thermoascus crustaceus]|uniref:uncharacterized protein n=1 Tax=Thermoascus crustaceus TaxID=5088 RepID=UPI003743AA7A
MAENGSPSKDINRDEATFLVEVIKNMDEQRSVDLAKVAEALGYTSVGSVANRFRLLKKKYDLKLSGRQGSLKSAAAAASGESATIDNPAANDENQVDSSVAPASATPSPAKPGRRPRAANPRPRKGAKASTNNPIPATKGMGDGTTTAATTSPPTPNVNVAGKTANLPTHGYPEAPGIHPALLLAVEIALWEREREKQAQAAKVNVSQAPSANDEEAAKDEVDDDA